MNLWSRRQLAARAALLLLAAGVGAFVGVVAPYPGVSVAQSVWIGIGFAMVTTSVILIAVRVLEFVIKNWSSE